MDSNQLKHFHAIATYGNITRAAEALFITQPALSISLKKLEEELGCRLFVRHGRTMELTEEGTKLLRYANIVIEALDNATREIGLLAKDRPISLFRIGGTAIALLLSGLYNIPDLRIEQKLIYNREVTQTLQDWHQALLIADDRYVPDRERDRLKRRLLYRQRLLLSVHLDDPLSNQETITVKQLGDIALAGRSGQKGFNDWVNEVASDNGCVIRETYQTDYILFAAEGNHITYPFLMNSFGESVAMSQVGFASRKSIPVEGRYTERDIYLWYDERVEKRTKTLIDLMVRNAEIVRKADAEMHSGSSEDDYDVMQWFL